MESPANPFILRIHCSDKPGIIAAVTKFVQDQGGNIIDLDQHTDPTHNRFYMRVAWSHEQVIKPATLTKEFKRAIAEPFAMNWDLQSSERKPRIALFVSKQLHCLYDILGRWQTKEWEVDIPLIISNHAEAGEAAAQFGIDYHHIPIQKENKREQEAKQKALLAQHQIDLIVLARYMQILTGDFIRSFPDKIINIHHSFLPAFPGARPYHSAFERGVKIIGATSHYVTEELDEGPIIEQDIVHVTHRDRVEDLIRKGLDLETLVLSRAVWKHIQSKTLVTDNRTIIFN